MSLFFAKRHQLLLGVDVSANAIKVVDIDYKKGRYTLNNYALMPLESGLVDAEAIIDCEAVGIQIAELMQRSKMSKKGVAAAVSSESTIHKTISMLATLNDTEREADIRLDAEKHIPYPLPDASFDFERIINAPSHNSQVHSNKHLPKNESESDVFNDILLVVARTEHIEQRVDMLVFAGLKAVVIEVDTHATQRASEHMLANLSISPLKHTLDSINVGCTAIVSIGEYKTRVQVYQSERCVFEREQPFGEAQLTQAVQLAQAVVEAEQEEEPVTSLNTHDNDNNKDNVLYPNELTAFAEQLSQHIQQALQFYYSSCLTLEDLNHANQTATSEQSQSFSDTSHSPSAQHAIKQIFLAGEFANLTALIEPLKAHLNIAVTTVNPFVNMTIADSIDRHQLAVDAPRLMTACGLALRGRY